MEFEPARFYVLPGERVRLEERLVRTWGFAPFFSSFVLGAILWGGLALVFLFALPEALASAWPVIGSIFVLHLLLTVLYIWRRLVTTEYVVTDEAVYARRGRLVLTVASALLDRVTDLHVHTGLWGRVLGYSGLSVRTAGGGVWLPGLHKAFEVRAAIQDARHQLLTQLLRESGIDKAPAARADDGTEIQCPRCGTVFPVAPTRPLDVECPQCHETGVIFEEAAA